MGDRVHAGEVIATLEPLVDTASRANLQSQRRQLHGQIESAEAKQRALETELSRVETLEATHLATAADLARAQAADGGERAQRREPAPRRARAVDG